MSIISKNVEVTAQVLELALFIKTSIIHYHLTKHAEFLKIVKAESEIMSWNVRVRKQHNKCKLNPV